MPSESHKKKRMSKDTSDTDTTSWECTMCTYRNKNEAFKCEMCDTRKGTSTRKPKLNENVVERQKTMHNFVVQQQEKAVNSYSFKKSKVPQSMSPTNSRHSPVSSCSSSQSQAVKSTKAKRAMVPIPDVFIYRTSPKKLTVVVGGEASTITEFRRKPITNDRVGPRTKPTPSST